MDLLWSGARNCSMQPVKVTKSCSSFERPWKPWKLEPRVIWSIPGEMGPSEQPFSQRGSILIGEERWKLTNSKPRKSGVPDHPSFCVGNLLSLGWGRKGALQWGPAQKGLLLFGPSPFSPAELSFMQTTLLKKLKILATGGGEERRKPTIH